MKRRIVAEVKRRLKGVREVPYGDDTPFGEDVESAVEVGLVRVARLRQAVLRSAASPASTAMRD